MHISMTSRALCGKRPRSRMNIFVDTQVGGHTNSNAGRTLILDWHGHYIERPVLRQTQVGCQKYRSKHYWQISIKLLAVAHGEILVRSSLTARTVTYIVFDEIYST